MTYQFSLQKLLDLKEKEKELLQSALSTAMKNLEEEQLIQSKLMNQRNDVGNQLVRLQEESTPISILMGLHSFQQRLEKNIVQSSQRVAKSEQDVNQKMQQVVDKSKEERTYQILKDRELRRFTYEQNRKEQNDLDEISMNLYLRGIGSTQQL